MANKLVLELLADTNNLLKGLEQAQRSVNKFVDSASTAGSSLGGGVNRALDAFADLASGGARAAGILAGGLVAAATAAVLVTTNAGKQVEAIDQLSQKTGIAIQTIQGWSVIMAENGFQTETLTSGMRTLSKQMTDARNPASQAASTFEELGISITALGSTESAIRAVADVFKDMPDGADKARLAVSLFGKAGLEMIPMLNRGSVAFDESRAAAERFGLVLSRQQVTALNAMDDASDRLGQALQGLKMQLAATFAGTVQSSIEAITEAVVRLKDGIKGLAAESDRRKNSGLNFSDMLKSLVPGLGLAQEFISGAVNPPPVSTGSFGPDQNSHMEDYLQNLHRQEELGLRIRNQLIEKFHLLESERHAQEALGKTTVAIIQRETAERNAAFAMMLEQDEALNNQQFKPTGATASKVWDQQIAAVTNLLELYPELNAQEAALLAIHNQDRAAETIQASTLAYEHRNDALDDAVAMAKTLDDAQQALFQSESGLLGASDAARRVRMTLIDAEAARARQAIDETIFDETRKAEAIQRLEIETDTKRRQMIQQFPTFFEQQMQALVNSNTFSMGQMVSTWSGGIAQMVVHGGNLKAAWEQTQVALVQASLNAGVQMLARTALQASVEMGILSAAEAEKLGLKAASNATIIAGETATAGATVGIWAGASATIEGMFGALGTGVKTLLVEYIWPALVAVGNAIMGVLDAIATGFASTGFGVFVAVGIVAAIAGIALALSSLDVFAKGGIAFGPSIFGEAGPEAAIPLNDRGAAFMADMLGLGGGGGEQRIMVMLDGRTIGETVADRLMDRVYVEAGIA